jgi:hypothetical protein
MIAGRGVAGNADASRGRGGKGREKRVEELEGDGDSKRKAVALTKHQRREERREGGKGQRRERGQLARVATARKRVGERRCCERVTRRRRDPAGTTATARGRKSGVEKKTVAMLGGGRGKEEKRGGGGEGCGFERETGAGRSNGLRVGVDSSREGLKVQRSREKKDGARGKEKRKLAQALFEIPFPSLLALLLLQLLSTRIS